jgi:hypothetical protein
LKVVQRLPHPADAQVLSLIPAQQKTNKRLWPISFQQLLKQDTVINKIESLRGIKQASIHFRPFIQIVIDDSFHNTRAQSSRKPRFEAKLQFASGEELLPGEMN